MGILDISLGPWLPVFQIDWVSTAMINILKNGMKRLNKAFVQYRQLGGCVEDEDMAMNCGTFNPRFLAKIKRSKEEKPAAE